jgi:phosphoglycerate dehydrogenase-like enzyme
VAPKAKAFGMRVVTYDPYVPKRCWSGGVGAVEFDELVKISDYISIHTPLLPETHHLFNADVFRQMNPTASSSTLRAGPVVDEAALARALDAGQLAGAALDVMEQEPPPVLAAVWPRQRDFDAAHQFLFRRSRSSICRPKPPKRWCASFPASAS